MKSYKGLGKQAVVKALIFVVSAVFSLGFLGAEPAKAAGSTLFLSPSNGTFQVDSTFDVSVFLNTQGNSVNTIDMALRYPPDKLQLVSSGTGKSIIGLWTSQPKYNNQTGLVELTGGVPGGVNVERGLITTLTFRVKAVGSAIVKFDRTKVLLNDGLGTEVLTQTQNSIYDLILPPPAGPTVISETHPDQTQWYRNNTVVLRWGLESGADGFSYIVSDQPIDVPDEISEGRQTELVYRNLADGRRYFHIRALRNGTWGGTTHFALNIDTTPPAEYKIDIIPNSRTAKTQPVIQFETTDALSGADHYEIKVVSLKPGVEVEGSDGIFIESQSPYIPPNLELGNYDVIVRAYDKAGNYREVTERLEIVQVLFRFIGPQGFEVKSSVVIPWWIIFLILLIVIIALWILGHRMHLWHRYIERRRNTKFMPETVVSQMEELQRYRSKYGKIAAIALLMMGTMFMSSVSVNAQGADSQQDDVFDTPLITTLSRNISNEEIFYIGGRVGKSDAEVIIYIQNQESAETISETVKADKNGEWFYRHDVFLPAGNYVLWAQARTGNQMSPPSPQVNVEVEETAVQFGATRVSYATLYLILFTLALLVAVGLLLYILYHSTQGRKKHLLIEKEISEAQESLRRGFAVLNRDIQAELEILRRAKLSQQLSTEQAQKEAQLIQDLQQIEQFVSKEIWDIEHAEQGIK